MPPSEYFPLLSRRGIHSLAIALTRGIGNHPLSVLILPAVYFLVRYLPFWNGPDVVGQLLRPAASVNILHYPPIYCFLARIPFWIAGYALQGGAPTIFSAQHPSLPAIYLLVFCQQVALCFSLRYFLFSIPTTALRRGLLAILLASTSSFYSLAYTCGSEALLAVSWFTVFGSGIRLIQAGGKHITWIVYSAALLLGIGSRHTNGVLLIWLPTLCAMLLVIGRWISRLPRLNQSSVNLGKIAVLALVIGAGVFSAEKLIVDALCQRFQVIRRNTLGTTLSDRISSIVEGLSDQGKAKLFARVAPLTSDSLVKLAITSQIYVGSYYGGTGEVITSALVERGMRGEELYAARDRIILQSSSCFYRAVPSRLLKVMWKDFLRAMWPTNDKDLALVGPFETLHSAREALKSPAAWDSLRGLPIIDLSTASAVVRSANSDIFLRKWSRVSNFSWCLIFLVISIVRLRRKTLSPGFFAVGLSILGLGVFSCFSYFICVFYLPRYVLPLMVSVMACGSVLVGFRGSSDGAVDPFIGQLGPSANRSRPSASRQTFRAIDRSQ
jgi:hypothetical protein